MRFLNSSIDRYIGAKIMQYMPGQQLFIINVMIVAGPANRAERGEQNFEKKVSRLFSEHCPVTGAGCSHGLL